MGILLITNNSEIKISDFNEVTLDFRPELDQLEILTLARDSIHLGAKLLIHPMMGRLKPHETPYQTVLLEIGGTETHFPSVEILEQSIVQTRNSLNHTAYRKYRGELLEDLRFIDRLLLENGMRELGFSRAENQGKNPGIKPCAFAVDI